MSQQMFDPNQAPAARPSFPSSMEETAAASKKAKAPKRSLASRFSRSPKADKAPKAAKSSAKRSHMTMIGAAVAFGLVAVLLVVNLGSSEPTAAPVTYVARSKAVTAANMAINADDLAIMAVSPDVVEAGAVSADTVEEVRSFLAENILGHYTVAPLTAGEQIHTSDFGADVELAVTLTADERVISVRAQVGDAAGGVLAVGDHVDVIAMRETEDRSVEAYVVVESVEIAGVRPGESAYSAIASAQASEEGRDIDPSELLPGAPVPGLYLLKVSMDDALELVSAGATSDLTLAYRAAEVVVVETLVSE